MTEQTQNTMTTKEELNIKMAEIEKNAVNAHKKQLAEDIAETFRNWKREYRINQDTFADLIGSSQPRVSNILNGRVDSFTVDKLIGFCARIQLSASIQSKPLRNMKTNTKIFIEESQKETKLFTEENEKTVLSA